MLNSYPDSRHLHLANCQVERLIQFLVLFAFFLLALPCEAKRIALVIGNSSYKVSPLTNPVNDARDFEAQLKRLGFDGNIVKRENLKKSEIGRTIREFISKISEGDEVVIFYAGHGVQVKGVNYLPAVDADIEGEEDVQLNSLSVSLLLEQLDAAKAGIKILFLDACRNNPFARTFRSLDRGLARIGDAPSGTLISFATRPGSVAADGTGRNGLFTSHLLKHLSSPGVPIEQLLKRVAIGVENESSGKQEPWTEGSIRGDFFFSSAKIDIDNGEQQIWNAIKDSTVSEPFEEYLRQYPSGRYISQAKILNAKIKSSRAKETDEGTESKIWQTTLEKAQEIDFNSYIYAFPNGKFVSIAKSKLSDINREREAVAWEAAAQGTRANLESYIAKYPSGVYIAAVRERLNQLLVDQRLKDEITLWSSATGKFGLNSYIAQYPKGRYVEEAKRRLSEIEVGDIENQKNQLRPPQKPIGNIPIVPAIL